MSTLWLQLLTQFQNIRTYPTVYSIVSGASNEHPESAPSPIEIVPMSSVTSRRAADADEIEVVGILRSQYAHDQNTE